jgi:hypothetical protein
MLGLQGPGEFSVIIRNVGSRMRWLCSILASVWSALLDLYYITVIVLVEIVLLILWAKR